MSLRLRRASRHPDSAPPARGSVDTLDGGEEDEFEFEVDDADDDDFEFDMDDEDVAEPDIGLDGVDDDGTVDLAPDQTAAIDLAVKGLESKTFYEVLLLPRTADAAAVKRAYYKLSKEYHPDRFYRKKLGPYKAKLELLFNKITEAYRVLGDVEARDDYDQMIFPELGTDTLDHVSALKGVPSAATPAEASVSVDFVPEALRKKQEKALLEKRKKLAEKAKNRKKAQKPLFMHKLQRQLAARIAKARKHMELGKERQEAGDLQAAVTHFQMAMSLDPRDKKAKIAFKRVSSQYRNSKAEQYYREAQDASLSEDYKTAAAKLQLAVECKPTKGKYHNEFGKLIIEHTLQHRVGLEQLRKAVELESRNVPYIMDLAGAYADLGMPSNAVRAYERVLQMDRKNAAAAKALKKLK